MPPRSLPAMATMLVPCTAHIQPVPPSIASSEKSGNFIPLSNESFAPDDSSRSMVSSCKGALRSCEGREEQQGQTETDALCQATIMHTGAITLSGTGTAITQPSRRRAIALPQNLNISWQPTFCCCAVYLVHPDGAIICTNTESAGDGGGTSAAICTFTSGRQLKNNY